MGRRLNHQRVAAGDCTGRREHRPDQQRRLLLGQCHRQHGRQSRQRLRQRHGRDPHATQLHQFRQHHQRRRLRSQRDGRRQRRGHCAAKRHELPHGAATHRGADFRPRRSDWRRNRCELEHGCQLGWRDAGAGIVGEFFRIWKFNHERPGDHSGEQHRVLGGERAIRSQRQQSVAGRRHHGRQSRGPIDRAAHRNRRKRCRLELCQRNRDDRGRHQLQRPVRNSKDGPRRGDPFGKQHLCGRHNRLPRNVGHRDGNGNSHRHEPDRGQRRLFHRQFRPVCRCQSEHGGSGCRGRHFDVLFAGGHRPCERFRVARGRDGRCHRGGESGASDDASRGGGRRVRDVPNPAATVRDRSIKPAEMDLDGSGTRPAIQQQPMGFRAAAGYQRHGCRARRMAASFSAFLMSPTHDAPARAL